MKKFDVLIGGYYGFGNVGDEAMLDALCASLREVYPDICICVLSATPADTARRLGVSSVKRNDPAAVLAAMAGSGAYISGGGSLLQDTTSRRSLWYYSLLMLLGKLLCGRLYVFANGIGEIKQVDIATAALRAADRISVRDPSSVRRLSDMGISEDRVTLCADPALLLDEGGDAEQEAALRACGVGKRAYFAVSLRTLERKTDMAAIEKFAALNSAVPLFVSMEDKYDLELCSTAAAQCGGAVFQPQSYSQLAAVLKDADFAIGMRLHFLVAAASVGIPFGALSYDCKTDDFMEYVGSDASVRADAVDTDKLFCLKSKMTAVDNQMIDELRRRARRDALQLAECITGRRLSVGEREKIGNMR